MPITTEPATFFGHLNTTRKVLTSFLDFFNSRYYVERFDEDGNTFKYIRVPIHYSNREQFIQIVTSTSQANSNTSNDVEINRVLPRMAVSINSLTYTPERKIQKFNKISANNVTGSNKLLNIISPAPYRLGLTLSILTKTHDDAWQIIEQILPYFTPTFTQNVKILDNFEPLSIQYSLDSVNPDANEEYGINTERLLVSTLAFSCTVNYYYQKLNTGVIKNIVTDFHTGNGEDWKKIKSYELTPMNLTPVTTVEERHLEPMTQTITEYE